MIKQIKQTLSQFSKAAFLLLLCFVYIQTAQATSTDEPKKTYTNIKLEPNQEILIPFTTDKEMSFKSPVGFKNLAGEIKIPIGTYYSSWSDTLRTFSYVFASQESSAGIVAIDRYGNLLFDVYMYDNGPDYGSDGLMRVKRNGKIGYANYSGEVVIPCRYECAWPFENGKAKVALNCELKEDKWEHVIATSDQWIYINKKGEVVQK